MQKENKHKSIEEIVREIVVTTDNTYDTYLELIEHRSKKIIDRINNKLNQQFSVLYSLYIQPLIENNGELFFRYSEKDYKKVDTENWTVHTLSEIEYNATKIWIERKESELKKFQSIYKKKYPTFQTSSPAGASNP